MQEPFDLLKGQDWGGIRPVFLEETSSTNEYAKANIARLPHGSAVLTRRQTAGKGRLGRGWIQLGGVAVTVVVVPPRPDLLPLLPIAAAAAVQGVLEPFVPGRVKIKWPNDIICSGSKICGILCESVPTENGRAAVCGMGMNLWQPPEAFREAGLPYAGSLYSITGERVPLWVLPAMLNAFLEEAEALAEGGIAPLLERYRRACANLGRRVTARSGDGEIAGVACGIGEDGSLLIETEGGVRPVYAGEVTLSGFYGAS